MNDIMLPKGNAIDPLLGPAKSKRSFVASPRDLLFILFWHRRKVVGFFTIAMLLTALAVLALPNTYRSESKLLVKLGSDTINPSASSSLGGQVIQPVIYWEVQMKTELEVLRSREVASSVVDELGAGRILRKGDITSISRDSELYRQALLALQNNLSLEVVPDSSIMMVGYQSGDGKLAHDITEAYVNRYLMLRSGIRDSKENQAFLDDQREDTVKKVQELEDKIRNIQDEAGVGNIAESRQLLQNRIGAMESDMETSKANSKTSEAEASQIKEQLKTIPEHVVSETTINAAMGWRDELKKDIGKLEIEFADAKARFVDNAPQVQIIQLKLNTAREALNKPDESERKETLNDAYKILNNRMEEARANSAMNKTKVEVLTTSIADAGEKLKKINEVEMKITQLKRSSNLSEATLGLISAAADRAGLLSAFQNKNLNNVAVIQPATLPLKPIAPNRLLLLMLGMFVAATGAVGLGIISETLSKTAKRPEDIDRLSGLPSVSVPVIDSPSFIGAANALGSAVGIGSTKRLLGVNQSGSTEILPTHDIDTNSALVATGPRVGEARLQRRWSPQLLQSANGIIDGLLFDAIHNAKNQQAFVTGVISCRPGQGASTLSAYIASAIADRLEASLPLHPDDRVLLVDSDINEPSLHRILSVDDTPGLGDWLTISNIDAPPVNEFLHPTLHSRLSVMPGGRSSTLTRLLDRVDLLIDEATRGHRHIVLDLPPVSSTPTSLRLAAKCTAVLLVVECGNLHQEVVRRSVAALQAAGANVVGVILNKRRFPIPDWLYERAS